MLLLFHGASEPAPPPVTYTIEQSLNARAAAHSGLRGLVGDAFYTDLADQSSGLTVPYVVFWRVSTVIPQAMGTAVDEWTARFQFDLYAATKSDLNALFEQVMDAFHRWRDTDTYNVVDILFANASDGVESVMMAGNATQVYKRSVDFMVIYNP